MAIKKKQYVVFESPGSFTLETSQVEVPNHSPTLAMRLSKDITERHGAKPYAFRFETRIEADPLDDGEGGTLEVKSKTMFRSGRYFINGVLRTLDDVICDNKSDERILRSNMKNNNYPIVCETRNSYLSTHPFDKEDFVVNSDGKVIERGDDPKHVTYREAVIERIAAEAL